MLALLLACASPRAPGQSALAGELRVDDAWSRAMPPVSSTGAVYLSLSNGGTAGERLVSASASVAERTELHSVEHADNLMKMRQVPAVEVPAGGRVRFEPGGLHIMLVGLLEPLVAGESLQLTLVFEHAGEVTLTVPILEAGARHPGSAMQHGHHAPGGQPGSPAKQ